MAIPTLYHRRSVRLKDYDYSQVGAYFVTVCAYNHECIFGDVVNGEMRLNDCGRIVEEEWLNVAHHRENVEMAEYIVMPNHFHGVLMIVEGEASLAPTAPATTPCRGRACPALTPRLPSRVSANSLPTIIGSFKSAAARRINILRNTPAAPIWQRGYYEHVARNETELNRIGEYIIGNPQNWELDEENPLKGTRHRAPTVKT